LLGVQTGSKTPLESWEYFIDRLLINGVAKTTGMGRLTLSTNFLIQYLQGNKTSQKFLDIGASDGSSTYYTHTNLIEQGIDLESWATDRFIQIHLTKSGILRYYSTSESEMFMCVLFNTFAISLYPERHKDMFSRWLAKKMVEAAKKLKNVGESGVIKLTHPSVIVDDKFHVNYLDVFKLTNEYINNFNIVRCSNLLQSSYFSDAVIMEAINTINSYIVENGILILTHNKIGSNVEEGIVLKKDNKKFVIIHRFSEQSEIERIINMNGVA
jgi:hypothetical protein